LRNEGICIDGNGRRIRLENGLLQHSHNFEDRWYPSSNAIIFEECWQAWAEQPPAKGTLVWAKEQDCRVCHVSIDNPGAWVDFSKGTNSMLLDNKTAWENPIYIVGWTIWKQLNCMLCSNEIKNKGDGPIIGKGGPLVHYECHGKYEGYHAILTSENSEGES